MLDVLHSEWRRDAEMAAHLEAAAGVWTGGLTTADVPTPAVSEEQEMRARALIQQAVNW